MIPKSEGLKSVHMILKSEGSVHMILKSEGSVHMILKSVKEVFI